MPPRRYFGSFDVTITEEPITFGDTPAFRNAVENALASDGFLRLIIVKNDESTEGTQEFARFAADSFDIEENRPALNVERSASGIGFAISEINYTAEAGTVTLAWKSSQVATYAVESSADLQNWLEVDDGVESGGEETSFEHTPDAGTTILYYRVRRLQQ